MSAERVSASGKNLRVSLTAYFITVVFNFLTRRIFLTMLGSEYTGFSGMCGHVLNFLSLLEPGFDAACAFCLYKPLAFGDRELSAALMAYIKRVYRIIGVLTAVTGVCALPVVFRLSAGKVEKNFALTVYFLLLLEMSLSYFISYRRILPVSDQKSYAVTGYSCAIFVFSRLIQFAVLLGFNSYTGYLLAGIAAEVPGELWLSKKIGKMYPYLKKTARPLTKTEKHDIHEKVRSLFFHKAGAILCNSVDNMAVFIFLGLHAGAVYSNYTMLSGTCLSFITVIAGSASASVGNLGVTAGKKRMLSVYSTALFAVFLLSGFFAQSLFFTYPLLVNLWVGKELVLGISSSALFCILMFANALRRPSGIFIDGFGLFDREKYKTAVEALITMTVTCILAPKYGINGVLLGQLAGTLGFSFFFEPYILFKYGFCESLSFFLRKLSCYLFAFILSFILSAVLCFCTRDIYTAGTQVILRIGICAFSTLSVFLIMFFDSTLLSDTSRYARKFFAAK